MESKEAMRVIDKFGIELPIGKAGEIINLIRELQKYKDMWERIEEYLNPGGIFEYVGDVNEFNPVKHIVNAMKNLKKDFFPEPKPKDDVGRYLLDKIEKAIKIFLQDIYHIRAEKETKERNKKGGLSC